jgi:hypothetical protein
MSTPKAKWDSPVYAESSVVYVPDAAMLRRGRQGVKHVHFSAVPRILRLPNGESGVVLVTSFQITDTSSRIAMHLVLTVEEALKYAQQIVEAAATAEVHKDDRT